ncbi:MAG TPA: DUF2235 domain-containing protein [Nocardioides sp.]|uniref:DUF2235 domain-containing protein n=1 Tax=Nocardioides sp. TaxID=35761 RepID=UPI002D7FDC49|nr:DUF2235 domain-containing protein [Nocardioides sp.]HET6653031.1 DUF2235 domain-containing protein [Nocardioides sp.]
MPKRLIMCCDGTWNTPDQQNGGRPSPTNVTKTALAIAQRDRLGVEQRVHYQRGVGTSRWERLRGGAFGLGLSRDVCNTYRFIVRNFEPGDELFFFGFSRGAFTARSTVGFVRNAGILRRHEEDRIDQAYQLYRSRSAKPRSTEARLFRQSYSFETRIRFIGVWDTVGALGIPLSGLRWVNALNRRWQFHDTELSPTVDAAFHALAIDEKRRPFEPALWRPRPDAGDQQLEQVWFAGAHSDVGGGHPQSQLSDIALSWMVGRAATCGLAFDKDAPTYDPAWATGPLHESRNGFYRLLPPYTRPIGVGDPRSEYAASSAVERHKRGEYTPPGLSAYLEGPHRTMQLDPRLGEVAVPESDVA